jgi:hypothetical protein
MIKWIKKISARRLLYLTDKRNKKKQVEAIIKKHNLKDPEEQQKIIAQFEMMQKSPRSFGRKTQEKIKDKIKFMIHYKLIKVV